LIIISLVCVPLTCSVMTLLLTGFVLMVQRYWPWSSGRMSRICKFHSFWYGLMTENRVSSMTRRSSYVSGTELTSSHATYQTNHCSIEPRIKHSNRDAVYTLTSEYNNLFTKTFKVNGFYSRLFTTSLHLNEFNSRTR